MSWPDEIKIRWALQHPLANLHQTFFHEIGCDEIARGEHNALPGHRRVNGMRCLVEADAAEGLHVMWRSSGTKMLFDKFRPEIMGVLQQRKSGEFSDGGGCAALPQNQGATGRAMISWRKSS